MERSEFRPLESGSEFFFYTWTITINRLFLNTGSKDTLSKRNIQNRRYARVKYLRVEHELMRRKNLILMNQNKKREYGCNVYDRRGPSEIK